jgi:hypothetical protein
MISALVTAGLEGGYPLAGRLAARIEQDALHAPWIEDYLVDRLLHTVRARGRIAAMGLPALIMSPRTC